MPLILWEDFLAAKEPQLRLGSEMRAYPWGYPGHCVCKRVLSPHSRTPVCSVGQGDCVYVCDMCQDLVCGVFLTATIFLSRFLKIVTALRSWSSFRGEELGWSSWDRHPITSSCFPLLGLFTASVQAFVDMHIYVYTLCLKITVNYL